jgi:phosphatidate cytidylyltransferase
MSPGPTSSSNDHAPGFRAIRFNMDWITRPLFGILLGLIVLAVVFYSASALAIALAIGFVPAAFEWHRCVGGGTQHRNEAILTAATVALSEAVFLYSGLFSAGVLTVLAGTIAQFVLAMRRDKHPGWQAAGVPYLAIPALCLVALCTLQHGSLIVVGLFLIVWATDTGALIVGNLIGGPRLAPKLSPGKTWAGTIGGSMIGALVFTFYISNFLGGLALPALAFGFAFSFIAHAGDLAESLVKRRFGLKNSGALIPGHGGVLDRIDSTLASAPAMALLVFVAHFNPVFGVHAS